MDRPLLIPRVIGHRGAAARAPENTLAGFRRAAELGCRWVEFDVRLSLDRQPMVFHDDTLERLTGGTGAVAAMPLAELLKLKTGGEPIPTLEETLAQLAGLGLGANLEMKADAGQENALATAVAGAIAYAALLPLLVSSFSAPAIAAFARHAPAVARGMLTEKLEPDWRAVAARLGVAAIVCDHKTLRPDEASAVRGAGLSLLTYTVNEPGRALELFAWGVDSVISDRPDAILAAMTK